MEDRNTLVFQPDVPLEQDQEYQVQFQLGKLIDVPEALQEFVFNFRTIAQSIELGQTYMRPYDELGMERQTIHGSVFTADLAQDEALQQTLTATQNGQQLPISWTHDENGLEHRFVVDSVERKDLADVVLLVLDGEHIGAEDQLEVEQDIPALGDYKVLSSSVVHQPDQFVLVTFSDPINNAQDLQGLVLLNGVSDLNTEVRSNELRVYPSNRLNGEIPLLLSAGLENAMGFKLGQDVTVDVLFEELKPAVRTVGNGSILPSTDGTLFPFEAVNLAAVDVSIIRIFENNILDFLQTNHMDGSGQIQRVGRPVSRKTIRLDQSNKDLGRWNRYYLDLNDIVKAQPGAIYRVELGFKKAYSRYACGSTDQATATNVLESTEDWDSFSEVESSFWDFYDSYYYGWYNDDYNYRERDDPCSESYYGRRRSVAKNFFSSDIGLIVKGGNDRSMLVAVNDLLTTRPLVGATVELFNFQDQLMYSLKTDQDGLVRLDLAKEKPFLLVAEFGGQKGYLKLDDGSSMNLSKFPIHGKQTQKGLKGFLYGDRGVWRPGDSLYLAFMLEDTKNSIPDHHPVSMELIDPRGRTITKTIHRAQSHGFFDLRTATPADAPTGTWQAKVKVGNAQFTKNLRIETVKPNRLKIALDFGEEDLLTAENSSLNGSLKATWLHGATARNLKANVELSLSQGHTSFENYPNVVFDDPVRRFEQNTATIFEGHVDQQGKAKINSPIRVHDEAPGMLQANFITRVFEKSGDHSIDRLSKTYSPYNTYVGVQLPKGDKARGMLLTDTLHHVRIVTVNELGEPVQRDSVYVALYQIQWRWWWQGEGEDLEDYFGSHSPSKVAEGWVSTDRKGEGRFEFKVNYPSWGRYLLRAMDGNEGHAAGRTVYIDWPGWAGRAQRSNPEAEQMLVLSADKENYQVGDVAEIFIPTGPEGRALLSIEDGSKVVQAAWITAQEGGVRYQLPITEAMAPNVYAHVSYLQPHGHTRNSLPIRMYGLVTLNVNDPNTVLHPELSMAKELTPETKTTLTIKERNGLPMTYTIAMVDEGLLDLTRFKTPDPWGHFFAKEALGVRTWDLYNMVIGAFGGKISPLLALGGDGEAPSKGKARTERFKPMVRYLGPFELKANTTAKHQVSVPNYVGSVRTMVVAGNGKAYGHTEKTTPVKKPLMVLATLPRVVGPGETVSLPVSVFAMDRKVKEVEVSVVLDNLFEAKDGSKRTLHFDQTGDQLTTFRLKVAEKLGQGQVTIKAKSGTETAYHKIDIAVRNPNPPMEKVIEKVIPAGQTVEIGFTPIGMEGTNSGVVELSTIPPLDLGRRLQYLTGYPHGCLEQTTSKAFPQVFLQQVLELDETMKTQVENNVKRGIQRLSSFQLGNGGLSYWPGNQEANDWGTTYAGHFVLEAERLGYALPSSFRTNWVKYQRSAARRWRPQKDRRWTEHAQAYRLYTLALANAPELGAMNRLRSKPNLQPMSKWRLAAAYHLAGKPEVAKELVKGLDWQVPEYKEMTNTYGSTGRDMAMILETLVIMGEFERAAPVVRALSKRMGAQRWMSTQTTAYALLAISKYAGSAIKEGLRYQIGMHGSNMEAHFSQRPIAHYPVEFLKLESGIVQVENQNSTPLHVRIMLHGTPVHGEEQFKEDNLDLQVSYHLYNGTPIDPREIEQGTDLYALVEVRHPGVLDSYSEMALTQIFPSGWEIRNDRMDGIATGSTQSLPTYQDVRDDRVMTYFDLSRGKSANYKVRLNAAYLGEFYLPAVSCEAMYDNDVSANTIGQWVRVVPPGGATKASK